MDTVDMFNFFLSIHEESFITIKLTKEIYHAKDAKKTKKGK